MPAIQSCFIELICGQLSASLPSRGDDHRLGTTAPEWPTG